MFSRGIEKVSDAFRGYRIATAGCNGLTAFILKLCHVKIWWKNVLAFSWIFIFGYVFKIKIQLIQYMLTAGKPFMENVCEEDHDS